MAFLAMISMESETSAVKVSIIKSADPVKRKVYFCYYLLAKGIRGILSYTKEASGSGSDKTSGIPSDLP